MNPTVKTNRFDDLKLAKPGRLDSIDLRRRMLEVDAKADETTDDFERLFTKEIREWKV
jgi:hypothetical protein